MVIIQDVSSVNVDDTETRCDASELLQSGYGMQLPLWREATTNANTIRPAWQALEAADLARDEAISILALVHTGENPADRQSDDRHELLQALSRRICRCCTCPPEHKGDTDAR